MLVYIVTVCVMGFEIKSTLLNKKQQNQYWFFYYSDAKHHYFHTYIYEIPHTSRMISFLNNKLAFSCSDDSDNPPLYTNFSHITVLQYGDSCGY